MLHLQEFEFQCLLFKGLHEVHVLSAPPETEHVEQLK